MPIYRTTDSNKDPRLQTRWYQNDYKECQQAVLSVLKAFGYQLKYQDDTYGELIFNRKNETLDVKIVSLQRKQTAIDFVLNVENIFDFGRRKAVIAEIYARLQKMLNEKKFS
ncbi:hypothetical protein N7603_03755 [Acholeplasma vituli]|uniref:Uncharacterized protein n=1 Tax=Paracholeplasma vituli TaxID=69473 RepID=A0ABT2PVA7_9MOLU|nr:hypothetical protein [Paracholeplasma vituli]MCU0104765.1 hypothetical protein [Paracholeplasma vituli]